MAMYFTDGPTSEQIKAAFDRARADGKSYLLMLTETCSDVLAIREETYVRAVSGLDEVVDVLREKNPKIYYGMSISLDRIYDVHEDFDVQNSFSRAAGVIAPAYYFIPKETAEDLRASLQDFYEQRNYEWSVQSWNQQPWFKKIFSKPPERPASYAAAEPAL